MRKTIFVDLDTLEDDELAIRLKSLRDAIICIGWSKLVSVIFYVLLYFLVHAYSKGHMSNVLQVMVLAITFPEIVNGILLFMGAIEEKVLALDLALWFSLIISCYNTIVCVMGAIYFIRTGHSTVHFLLAVLFGLSALNLYVVICHDILIIYAYKKILMMTDST